MAKKILAMVKLQIAAGKATPAPPVGTALGPHGLNIMDFCKNFNDDWRFGKLWNSDETQRTNNF